jgi:hypothetical protein
VSIEDDWKGLVGGRFDASPEGLTMIAPLQPSEGGSSGSFAARLSDGLRWYVKPLNNYQAEIVCVNEYVLGSLGRLIGAPVCEVAIVQITETHAGWGFKNGGPRVLESGLASASKAIPSSREERALIHRARDDNRRRQVGVYAMYDWCWGGDDQWLYDGAADEALHSHDHGHYLPGGPTWSIASLAAVRDEPHVLGIAPDGLDPATIANVADNLDAVTRETIAQVLRRVPTSWPTTDTDLEALGAFLEVRAKPVATRLRTL